MLEIDLAAQPRDVDVDHVVERRGARGFLPHVARQRFARDDLALVSHQEFQQLEFADGEVHGLPGPQHLPGDEIHFEIAHPKLRRIGDATAPDQRADSGEQLGKRERLDQVVVGARIETGHAILK